MYIITNALKNIVRNKGRNILIGIIIFAILLTSAVSIIINTTTGAIIKDYKNRFGSEVFINIDYALWQKYGKGDNSDWITPEQQIVFAHSAYLKGYNLTASGLYRPVNFETFEDMAMGGVIGGNGPSSKDDAGSGDAANSRGTGGDPDVVSSSLLTGTDNILSDENFVSGKRRLIDGRVFEKDNECLISQQLAEKNSLRVGDTIKVKSLSGDGELVLTVAGIFEDNTMLGNALSIRNMNNEIITNFNTAKNVLKEFDGYIDAKYYLNNPEDLEAFDRELHEKGLPIYYKAKTDERTYRQIVGPVEGLAKVTNIFLIVVLVLGSLILIVLSTLAIRERKYEIGVLRAMGMKKAKVAVSLLAEMLVITTVCLLLGLSIGALMAQPVADGLLKEQVAISQEGNSGGGMIMVAPIGGGGETLSEIDVYLSGQAVVQIALIALFLTVISSVGGIWYITRFEPMKILSERS